MHTPFWANYTPYLIVIKHYFVGIPQTPTPLWLPTPRTLKFKRYYRELRADMLNLIQKRREGKTCVQDLLSVLINLKHVGSDQPWSDDEIIGEMFSVYFGASVMSTTLAWCLYLVASHPDIQQKLAVELDQVLHNKTVTVEDLDKLKYTNRVLQETMRLYPPSWEYPRYCKDGITLGEYAIPSDSLVIAIVLHSHHHSEFWHNPLDFQPERDELGKVYKLHRFAYYPFGAGARMCLGANLAPLVLLQVIASLFQRFQLEFSPQSTKDPVVDFGFEMHPRDPIKVRCAYRSY